MAISHSTTTRNALADSVGDATDAGAGAGVLVFQSAGAADLCSVPLAADAWGVAANGRITLAAPPGAGIVATAGTTTLFELRDGSAAVIVLGTVSGTSGGGDIEITNQVLAINDEITISSLTYDAAT